MYIAVLTFDGFNELDSLIAYGLLWPMQFGYCGQLPGGAVPWRVVGYRLKGEAQAREVLLYFAPVGEKDSCIERAMEHILGTPPGS